MATAKATSPSLVYLVCLLFKYVEVVSAKTSTHKLAMFCHMFSRCSILFAIHFCHILPSWSLAGSAKDHNQAHLGAERQETAGIPESARHLSGNPEHLHSISITTAVLVSELFWYLRSTGNKFNGPLGLRKSASPLPLPSFQ